MTGRRAYHRALAVAAFFTVFAGDFWRYLLSWYGWGAVVGIVLVLCTVELVRLRDRAPKPPWPLVAVAVLILASVIWSHYRLESLLGFAAFAATAAAAVFMVAALTWREIVAALDVALRLLVGGSLLFELFVSVVVRRKVLPFWVDYSDLDKIPNAFYWSRDLLFDGGRIQGIVGNSNLLGFGALLLTVVITTRLLDRSVARLVGLCWLTAALATLALTRSATVIVAGIAVLLVVGIGALLRGADGHRRLVVGVGAAAAVIAVAVAVLAFRAPVLRLLGRSEDLTGRLEIWERVWGLIAERPLLGWGWVGYWPFWVEPFDDLAILRRIRYLQAHNAWLDVTMQLGIVGLLAFGVLIAVTAVRVARIALQPGASWTDSLPALLLAALLAQSLAESRLLIESGLLLLVILAFQPVRAPAPASTLIEPHREPTA